MVQGRRVNLAVLSAVRKEYGTLNDLSFLEFRAAIQELDDGALSQFRSWLASARSQVQQDLDQATRRWQEDGQGLPSWYFARFKLITVIERKLAYVSSVQQFRTHKDIYAQSVPLFRQSILGYGHDELKLIFAYLQSRLNVRQRGDKMQVVQGYLSLKRPAQLEQAQRKAMEFDRIFRLRAKALLDEEVYYAILNEARKAMQASDAAKDCDP